MTRSSWEDEKKLAIVIIGGGASWECSHTPVMFSLVAVSGEWCLYLRCATPGSRGPCWSRWWAPSRRQSRPYLDNNGMGAFVKHEQIKSKHTILLMRPLSYKHSLFHPNHHQKVLLCYQQPPVTDVLLIPDAWPGPDCALGPQWPLPTRGSFPQQVPGPGNRCWLSWCY